MNAIVVLGTSFGAGLLLVLSGLRPSPPPLQRALAELHRRSPVGLVGQPRSEPSLVTRLLGSSWESSPVGQRILERVAADLRITGTTPAQHLASSVAVALTGLLWAPCTAALMALGGVPVGLAFPLWGSLAFAPVGLVYPSIALRSRATERRRSFRHAFSAFLDIVSISLAGGRGVDSALHDGAGAGRGWAFDEVRRALLEARLAGETPWAGLDRLGTELGVSELSELAASAALAGSEGARVRSSLAAKARAIRLRSLAEAEAAAQSASERMSLPIVLLMVGFIVFLVYPAIDRVLTGI
jgi:Flp pilus assembly protein TadB